MEQVAKSDRPAGPMTLAIDVGGTHLKAGILSPEGTMTAGPSRVDTPHPAPPAKVVDALVGLAEPLGRFARISIGFPGVVRNGRVLTAPNLGQRRPGTISRLPRHWPNGWARRRGWRTTPPCRASGVIAGQGVECVITLGTGMGFALFEDGRPAPHLELSQHPVRGRKTYDKYIGNAALHAVGRKRWNRRVRTAIGFIETLTDCDVAVYRRRQFAACCSGDLPKNVRIVSNEAGITGGIRLWDAKLDEMFMAA